MCSPSTSSKRRHGARRVCRRKPALGFRTDGLILCYAMLLLCYYYAMLCFAILTPRSASAEACP